MSRRERFRRMYLMALWRVVNPVATRLAGRVRWWVVIETIGRRSGTRRRTPVARGPREPGVTWVIAVHGEHSSWVKNIRACPEVRVMIDRQWFRGTASVLHDDPVLISRFNAYARLGRAATRLRPVVVEIVLAEGPRNDRESEEKEIR